MLGFNFLFTENLDKTDFPRELVCKNEKYHDILWLTNKLIDFCISSNWEPIIAQIVIKVLIQI